MFWFLDLKRGCVLDFDERLLLAVIIGVFAVI
jgi:hypothetical protein